MLSYTLKTPELKDYIVRVSTTRNGDIAVCGISTFNDKENPIETEVTAGIDFENRLERAIKSTIEICKDREKMTEWLQKRLVENRALAESTLNSVAEKIGWECKGTYSEV